MAHRPQKKWGQNFLRNRDAARRIVEAIGPAAGSETIVEIGPGEGVLTALLLEFGRPVTAIEIDPALANRLRERFPSPLLMVRNEDATEAAMPEGPFSAVGNLPYNVATPILRRVVADPRCRRAVFMLQKEVADRIMAQPRKEPYGYLTLYVQLYADARELLTLAPGSFWPVPKVKSSVVVLDPVPRRLQTPREHVLELISRSFRMRRKTLVNNLIGYRGLDRKSVEDSLAAVSLGPGVRAEEMSLEEFDRLASIIESHGAAPAPE